MYWACAQLEPRRERLASHCLALAGYEIYQPLLREQRRSHGSKIVVTPPLFPGYLFLWVVSGWWNARWSPGVVPKSGAGLISAPVSVTLPRTYPSVTGTVMARHTKRRRRKRMPMNFDELVKAGNLNLEILCRLRP
jgi:hypothetical protein